MNRLILATALTFAATPILAQTQTENAPPTDFDAARSAVEAVWLALDTDSDGQVNRPELMAAAAEAFPIYDVDQSGDIDPEEFKTSSFGFSDMAAVRGRQQAYDAAFGLVFDLFDRVGDRRLSKDEFLTSIDRAFTYADFDADDGLTQREFMGGFITNVALRHAMRD